MERGEIGEGKRYQKKPILEKGGEIGGGDEDKIGGGEGDEIREERRDSRRRERQNC